MRPELEAAHHDASDIGRAPVITMAAIHPAYVPWSGSDDLGMPAP